jgi:hypothetical protein
MTLSPEISADVEAQYAEARRIREEDPIERAKMAAFEIVQHFNEYAQGNEPVFASRYFFRESPLPIIQFLCPNFDNADSLEPEVLLRVEGVVLALQREFHYGELYGWHVWAQSANEPLENPFTKRSRI